MDNHERDRRDSPDAEEASPPPAEGPQPEVDQPPHPEAVEPLDASERAGTDPIRQEPSWAEPDAGDTADTTSSAEIESWPSQDARSARETQSAGSPAWPTEPPSAGSAGSDAWPTEAPERAQDSDLERPRSAEPEPPPSEVEAYPVGSAASEPVGDRAATAAHAVPAGEGEIGESTQCPRCGTENRPGLAFCRSCGQRLVAAGVASTVERPGAPEGTMACPRCGTHNRAGVAFCQNCGANLRGAAPGYVPPPVATEEGVEAVEVERRGAVLGPVVLLIGMVGVITGYLLPFLYGSGSLFERAMGPDGYGAAFWSAYPEVSGGIEDQAYYGLAGPIPLLGLLLLLLAVAGFMRARPGTLQSIGLGIALLWSIGLVVLFVVVELAGNWTGDLVGMLRVLTPAGIIFMLSALIVLIGTLTRFGRS